MKTNHETTVPDVGADVDAAEADHARKVSNNVLRTVERHQNPPRKGLKGPTSPKGASSTHRDGMSRVARRRIDNQNPNHRLVTNSRRPVSPEIALDETAAVTAIAAGPKVPTA